MIITPDNVMGLEQADKVRSFSEMPDTVRRLRESGLSVYLAQGVFDLIHAGHVGYLREAIKMSDGGVLVVGIENDESVARNKGPSRPINPLDDRLDVLSELMSVSLVFPYEGVPDYNNPNDFIERYELLLPDAVIAASFDPHKELKAWQAEQAGTTLGLVDYQHINSTTRMLNMLGYQE